MIKLEEKEYLRELARKVKEYSTREHEKEKAVLWTNHNDLKDKTPIIYADPEGGWAEIITPDMIKKTSEQAKEYEIYLLKQIFFAEKFKSDAVISDEIIVSHSSHKTGYGFDVNHHHENNSKAYKICATMTDYSMLDKIKTPQITVDYEETERRFSEAKEIFGGILDVSLKSQWWWTLGMTDVAVNLRGLEEFMFDMYDYPDELKELMSRLRDANLEMMEDLEKRNLLYSNVGNCFVGSGGIGFTNQLDGSNPSKLNQMWGFCESQETSSVSAEMFAEFVLPYQIPILEKFGLNSYGCCERLNERWKYIKDIKNLRRVSCSPWSDVKGMSELLQDKFVLSYKPNPTLFMVDKIDEDQTRADIKRLLDITKDNFLEIIVKDNATLNNRPENLYKYIEIFKQEREKI